MKGPVLFRFISLFSVLILLTGCNEQDSLSKGLESAQTVNKIQPNNEISNPSTSNPVVEASFMAILVEDIATSDISQLELTYGIKVYKSVERFNMIAFKATSTQAQLLKQSSLVKEVQEDVIVRSSLNTAITQIRAKDVHNYGHQGNGVRVCIIDSGLNPHTDLPTAASEYDFVSNDSVAEDLNGHGTAVAGIIASQNQGTLLLPGYTGVSKGVTLLIAKVFGAQGTASSSTIASALDWCASQDADVINMSLGHGGYTSTCDTDMTALFANTVANKGIVVVAASGNDGYTDKISSPACGSKVISVGSVTKTDLRSSFSNGGSKLELTAPGENITTTNRQGGYSTFSGTSAAAPFVTGVVALLKALPENPSASGIKDALFRGAKDLGASGKDNSFGYGRVDALGAYNIIRGINGGGGSGSNLKFVLSGATLADDAVSSAFKHSQMKVTQDCPANHYLTDIEVQRSIWFVYRSLTWFKLKCQSMSALDTTKEMGMRRYSGTNKDKTDLCTDRKAITSMSVVTDRFVKDLKMGCSQLSYNSSNPGSVSVINKILNATYAFDFKQRDDDERLLDCPQGTVAVGLEGSAKKDNNEWAFTRLGLRCADIWTERK